MERRPTDQPITARVPTGSGEIVRLIAEKRATTRADLARHADLSRSTVSSHVDALVNQEILVDTNTAERSTGGRPGTRLVINADRGLILSADMGATRSRLAMADLAGEEHGALIQDISIDQEPATILSWITDRFDSLLAEAGRDARQVSAVVVGLPAPVDFGTQRVVNPPLMPTSWHDYPIAEYVAGRYANAKVLVENDVNLMALGELKTGDPTLRHLLFVKIGTGIGCAIVIDRELYRGAVGTAGDIGHIRVAGDNPPCRCGNTGCLEAVAGGQALADRLRAMGRDATDARDVVRLAQAGDIEAGSQVRIAAERIGDVLAACVSFANPAAIIINGTLAQLDNAMLASIRSGVFGQALQPATRRISIDISELRDRAGTSGAVALVHRNLMTDAGIAALFHLT